MKRHNVQLGGLAMLLSALVGGCTNPSPTPMPTQEVDFSSAQVTEAPAATSEPLPTQSPALDTGAELDELPGELPSEARKALDQRVKADFGTVDYVIATAQKSDSGASWCIVFDPPLEGALGGQTLVYDYAVVQPDGDSWNAIMVEDHTGGVVLSVFGCQAIYKESPE